MDTTVKFLIDNQKDVLSFLKTRYHLYHLSNVFFRDLHYGVMAYLEWKGMSANYTPSETITQVLVDSYAKAGILKNVARNAYVLNYPEFKKPSVKPAVPAKPAAVPPKTAVTAAVAQKGPPEGPKAPQVPDVAQPDQGS